MEYVKYAKKRTSVRYHRKWIPIWTFVRILNILHLQLSKNPNENISTKIKSIQKSTYNENQTRNML